MTLRCLYDDYLSALEYVHDIGETVFEHPIWPHAQAFLSRGWIRIAGYFAGQNIESEDGWVDEVTHDIDLAAGVYRYQNPRWRGGTVVRPLGEITFYKLCIERFLDDLSEVIGSALQRRSATFEHVPGHLWELGKVRVGQSSQWARVFVGRHLREAAHTQIKAWLDDEVWSGQSILLVHKATNPPILGEHIERCLSDLLEVDGGHPQFRVDKLQRILLRYAQTSAASGPIEYIEGNALKLAHLDEPIQLSPALARIVKQCWGTSEKPPPIVSWAETNERVKTGYVSFDDAFGSQPTRAQIFAVVKRGKYQLRRGEGGHNHRSTLSTSTNTP